MANIDIDLGKYSLCWSDPEEAVFKQAKGLNEEIIRQMYEIKKEPEWMLEFRLKAYKRFLNKPLPEWVAKEKLQKLDFDDIYYYIKPTDEQADSWDMVPDAIKETYEIEEKFSFYRNDGLWKEHYWLYDIKKTKS